MRVFFLVAISAFGCASASPVVRLEPDAADVIWFSGTGIVTSSAPGVVVAAAFADQQQDELTLRVEVRNVGEAVFNVDPRRFWFATYKAPSDPDAACVRSAPVLDPERKLVDLAIARSQAEASAANAGALGASLVLLDTVAAVASAAKGNAPGAAAAAEAAASTASLTASSVEHHASHADWFETRRTTIATEALRLTTLPPGQAVAGLVYLPIDQQARAVRLFVKISDQWLRFPFKQLVFSPPPPPRPTPRR